MPQYLYIYNREGKGFVVTRIFLVVLLFTVGALPPELLEGQQPPKAASTEKPPAPLTEVRRLQLLNAAQAVELARFRLQQAQQEFDRLLQAAQVPGYVLNEKLEYVKATKDPAKPPEKGS